MNFVLLRDGDALTLIDGGYPGDVAAVDGAIRSLGQRPEDVEGMLLTHAHVDHMGAVVAFHESYGIPVFTDSTEVAHARREYLEQATGKDFIPMLHKHGVLAWLVRIARAGATRSQPSIISPASTLTRSAPDTARWVSMAIAAAVDLAREAACSHGTLAPRSRRPELSAYPV